MKLIISLITALPVLLFAQASKQPQQYPATIFRGQPVAGVGPQHTARITLPADGAIVLFFTGTRCPYDDLYRKRLAALEERFRSKVSFYYVNAMADEASAEMSSQISDWKIPIPYVIDSAQVMARALGVKKTTEAFLLRVKGDRLELYFRGPVDDNPQLEQDTNQEYLQQAIDAMLQGKTSPGHYDRIPGCLVRVKSQP